MTAAPLDPRARRSKQALEAALLDLAEIKDVAQISIADITRHAGVSRSTFYEHYADVHDLAAAACTVLFDELVARQPMVDPSTIDLVQPLSNPLVPVFTHFADHQQLYRSLLGQDGSARVINHLFARMKTRAYANLHPDRIGPADDPAGVPSHRESALIAGGLLGIAVDWLAEGCPGTAEQVAQDTWPMLFAMASVCLPDEIRPPIG